MLITRNALFILIMLGLLCVPAPGAASETKMDVAPRMDIPTLEAGLGSPDLIILDVRTDKDLSKSDKKIKGAIREEPRDFVSWADKYPRQKTIVLY
jgi:hypothetical protein